MSLLNKSEKERKPQTNKPVICVFIYSLQKSARFKTSQPISLLISFDTRLNFCLRLREKRRTNLIEANSVLVGDSTQVISIKIYIQVCLI